MKICLVTPAGRGSRAGNRVTAVRWAKILRALGHTVVTRQDYDGRRCDVLVALHARRSAEAIRRYRRERPAAPLVVVLTGTDLYGDIRTSAAAQRSLELASRLVVLQAAGVEALPAQLRDKTHVIYQSAEPPSAARRKLVPRPDTFDVCVLGHLRPVKDPFRAALAARRLPATSRVRVIQAGGAMSESMARRARAEAERNPRYRWLGELPRYKALRVLSRSRLLVLTSKSEGGANVVSEAIGARVPVLSSHIPGSIGILGADYPGYYPVGDTAALAALLRRAETDTTFYRTLQQHCRRLAPLVRPARERQAWARLLSELG